MQNVLCNYLQLILHCKKNSCNNSTVTAKQFHDANKSCHRVQVQCGLPQLLGEITDLKHYPLAPILFSPRSRSNAAGRVVRQAAGLHELTPNRISKRRTRAVSRVQQPNVSRTTPVTIKQSDPTRGGSIIRWGEASFWLNSTNMTGVNHATTGVPTIWYASIVICYWQLSWGSVQIANPPQQAGGGLDRMKSQGPKAEDSTDDWREASWVCIYIYIYVCMCVS